MQVVIDKSQVTGLECSYEAQELEFMYETHELVIQIEFMYDAPQLHLELEFEFSYCKCNGINVAIELKLNVY